MKDLQLHDKQIEVYTLVEIESIEDGQKFERHIGMPHPYSSLHRTLGNCLINEELDYDIVALRREQKKSYAQLNSGQFQAYDAIITSVWNKEGRLIFIHGHGGTGKTFLWNTIISHLRSQSKIVLPVATSGIAVL